MPSSRLGNCRSVAPIAHLHEQAFVAHAGQIATRNADVGQLFRPDYPILQGKCDRAFSEGRLRTAGQPNSLGSVAITLANLEGGLWRSLEGNRQHKVRSFVQPGEPPSFLRQGAILRANLRYSPTLRSASILLGTAGRQWETDRT